MGERYKSLLRDTPGIHPPVIADGNDSVYAQYTLLAQDRDRLSKTLKAQNIPSVAYYAVPLHLQGAFSDLGHRPGDFPIAEKVAKQCLSLPMHPYITKKEQQFVTSTIQKAISGW